VREEAVWASNLDWEVITGRNQAELVQALRRWRDANPNAAVLDIAYADGYAYAGRITRMVDAWTDNGRPIGGDFSIEVAPEPSPQDWGVCSALITLQRLEE
jgi:hypothetical protein